MEKISWYQVSSGSGCVIVRTKANAFALARTWALEMEHAEVDYLGSLCRTWYFDANPNGTVKVVEM